MKKCYIREDIWSKLFACLQESKGIYAKNEHKTRVFLEGVYWMMRTGSQWREMPAVYGHWRSIHKRFETWARKGIWDKILSCFSRDFDGETVMIDATIIRAHACAAGHKKNCQGEEALGRSKGGFTTKIHAVVDALGQVLRFTLTPGQRHDITPAPELLKDFTQANVVADKGYDSNALVDQIQNQNCTPVIPPRSNRKTPRHYDKHLYKERHLIECFFGKIKQFRRIFSRFDKKASTYMAFVAFASTFLWLR